MNILTSYLTIVFLLSAFSSPAIQINLVNRPESIPSPPHEFRAVWISTVANLDWPSRPGLPMQQQQDEATAYLNLLASLNFNAVILQVRPQCDAFYSSELEPWSWYLTGVQGKAPGYDPLEFWIKEAHNRGIELHAWFNPFRAGRPPALGEFSEKSIVKKRPDLARSLAEPGYYWLDPGKTESREHTAKVVLDVVKRYDIDGVHFDDYFYPYKSYNKGKDFPDDSSWAEYRQGGGKLSRADWRRDNINRFIENIYKSIKAAKPHVKFGISPFGIWRPDHPRGIKGQDSFATLYADSKLWLNNGWLDYFSPQLYWPIHDIKHSFPVILSWWSRQNTHHRNLWPGLATWRSTPNEIFNQIMVTRSFSVESPGNIHFRMKFFQKNDKNITEVLKQGPYREPALIPLFSWLQNNKPELPEVGIRNDKDSFRVYWSTLKNSPVFHWVFYEKYGDRWHYKILPGHARFYDSPKTLIVGAEELAASSFAVSAVNRSGSQGPPTVISIY